MPLSLATDRTCVVLAGDHLQMGQKVYSVEAHELNFDLSIVERLHNHYTNMAKSITLAGIPPPITLLRANYRNHPDILRFLSSIFYGGPDVLVAKSTQPVANSVPPLNFYAAYGCETQDPNSTSWYNLSEVMEVVERVSALYQAWPTEWGPRNAKSILVTTPYGDQVLNIGLILFFLGSFL